MTTNDLAAALESMAEEPTLCIALSAADVTELRAAAQRLRELEAVRSHAARLVALEESVRANVSVAWRDLRAALAGVTAEVTPQVTPEVGGDK